MGLGDIFKAKENKFLRKKNNELYMQNCRLEENIKKLTTELEMFKLKNKLSEDASILYSDWIMDFAKEYANILCSKFPHYSSLESFKSNYKNRNTHIYYQLQELIKQAAFYKAIKYRYPFLIEAINNGKPEKVAYYIKTIQILENYSYEDLKLIQSDIRIFEKKCQKNEEEFLKKEKALNKKFDDKFRELEEIEKSRQMYWDRMINNQKKELELIFTSSINSLPYVASLSADYILHKINEMQSFLINRKTQYAHEKEIKIRVIKKACQELIEEAKVAIYQLDYLKTLYPNLEDILDTEYNKLPFKLVINNNADPISQWVNKEEYELLSETNRNQLALERYIESRKKSKWQIGRDYELSIGYQYEKKGYTVDYFGSLNGVDDLGRDLIAVKDGKYNIIQCKYWSSEKIIHEKHIFQLYGSMLSFAIENDIDIKCVSGIFVTNIDFSDTAKKFAQILGIVLKSRESFKEFPRIKCNISLDGEKIYHLPMDQQYDNVKLVNSGETKVFTVKEAEKLGFRRAWRWHGSE